MAPYLPTSYPTDPLPMPPPGTPFDNRMMRHVDSWISSSPQAAQTATITVGTYTDGADYVFLLNGKTMTYRAVTADADQSGVAAKLADLINDEPLVSGLLIAEAAAAVVTITARRPGIAFTLSDSDAKITSAAGTANAEAASIPFGALLVRFDDKKCRALSASDVAAGQLTLVITASNSQIYSLDVVYNGVAIPITYTADGGATKNEIATGLKANLDSKAVAGLTATVSGADDLVLSGDLGVSLSVTRISTGTGAIAVTVDSAAVGLDGKDYGINERAQRYERLTSDTDGLPPNSVAGAGRVGTWPVATAVACAPGDPVYARVDVPGLFDKTRGANKVLVPRARWYQAGTDSVAAIELY